MHTPEILVKEKGSPKVCSITLKEGINSFGRGAGNTIHLVSPLVSRQHGVIQRWSNLVSLKDSHSTNGIRVNGQKVRHKILLTGDVIEIGPFELHVKHGSIDQR